MVNIFQDSRTLRLGLAPTFSLALLAAVWLALGAIRSPEWALAQGPAIRYVAPTPIGSDSDNDCLASSTPCATVQHAVDMAAFGDEIRVAAGVYAYMQGSAVVYLNKTVTIQGGYTITNWSTPYPLTQSTTLDAQGQSSVIYIAGIISPTVKGLILTGGNTSSSGGGIQIHDSSPTLSHNIITNNQASVYGGGVYVVGRPAAPLLDGNRIISNTAVNGGGVFIDDFSAPVLINNVIADNRGRSDGGGIYIDYYSTPTIINNTIAANNLGPASWANQGIVVYNNPSPIIMNNIIVTHTCGIAGEILSGTIDYNDVWGCSFNCYCGADHGPHSMSVDPRFVNSEGGDYHLRDDSPVIDKGTDDGAPPSDFDANPRPFGCGVDIGAYEVMRKCLLYLPVILRH